MRWTNWLTCELRCYAFLLRSLHRIVRITRHGILLRSGNEFEFTTLRGKRGGWAGSTIQEGLEMMRWRGTMRRAPTDPVVAAYFRRF